MDTIQGRHLIYYKQQRLIMHMLCLVMAGSSVLVTLEMQVNESRGSRYNASQSHAEPQTSG